MNHRRLEVETQSWPLRQEFKISRGSKTHADVIEIVITQDGHIGRAECVPYDRYGESLDSVLVQIRHVAKQIEAGESRLELNWMMPAGAARNLIDCALWDLEAKIKGKSIGQLINFNVPSACQTAQTISVGLPQEMAAEAQVFKDYPLLKLKLGRQDILACVKAVSSEAPQAKFIIDANEAWDIDLLNSVSEKLNSLGVVLIEQPLPAEFDADLSQYNGMVPLCADESFHVAADILHVKDYYQSVNIKLDKTGGLTEAIQAIQAAKAHSLKIMIGCMVGTSLAMAPAFSLVSKASWVDLDGPALLLKDRCNGFNFNQGMMRKGPSFLWS